MTTELQEPKRMCKTPGCKNEGGFQKCICPITGHTYDIALYKDLCDECEARPAKDKKEAVQIMAHKLECPCTEFEIRSSPYIGQNCSNYYVCKQCGQPRNELKVQRCKHNFEEKETVELRFAGSMVDGTSLEKSEVTFKIDGMDATISPGTWWAKILKCTKCTAKKLRVDRVC